MICPYCKQNIKEGEDFCPVCGQQISNNSTSKKIDVYWERVNNEAVKESEKFSKKNKRINREVNTNRNKFLIAIIAVIVIIIGIIFGIRKYQQYQEDMIREVELNLAGKTMTAHSSHVEGLGWIYHEYRQFTFTEESMVDYYYIETIGPKEEDEMPEYQGTYGYTVARSVIGNYKININGETYELSVDDNNIPTGISF